MSGAVAREESREFYQLAQQRDGTLVGIPGHWWTHVGNPEFSQDYGATWATMSPLRTLESWPGSGFPVVLPDGGFAVLSNQVISDPQARRRRHESERRLRVGTNNEILHWGEQLSEGCSRLVPELSGPDELFVACDDGRLLLSTDSGRSWSVDLDTTMGEDETPEILREGQTT